MTPASHICPHCKQPTEHALRDLFYYTCRSCSETFVYYEDAPAVREALFKPVESFSPVAIGSRGKAGGRAFEVSGTVTLFQERGMMLVHALVWEGTFPGFLIEDGSNFFAVDAVQSLNPALFKKTSPGKVREIASFGKAYCYSMDKIGCVALKGTGKLVFPKYSHSICCSFYKDRDKGAYAFISRSEVSFLSGNFYNFEALQLSPQRSLHDWNTR